VSLLVLTAFAWVGWSVALAALLALRRRCEREADAAHELRGAATAIGLAVERMELGAAPADLGPLVRVQLARVGGALGDLGGTARARSPDFERLAQVIANLAANAAEHGVGAIDVSARRMEGGVRLEVSNRERERTGNHTPSAGRGRGLAIAARAARALGGRLRLEREGGVTRAVVELPPKGGHAVETSEARDDVRAA
jgi:signal transduction histidine kinase